VEGSRRVENQNQHHWDGDTLIEHSTWKFLGHRFTLERRWNLSDDGSSVEISERIEGPKSDERVTLSFLVG
jgi:hypothetical protein